MLKKMIDTWDMPWRDEHHPSLEFMLAVGKARKLLAGTNPQESDMGQDALQHYDGRSLEIIGAEAINIMISEDGRRVWVCTEHGTVLRAKLANVNDRITLEDNRIVKT